MCTNWNVIADIGSDNLEMCFKIMDAYIVLCASNPEQFTQVIWTMAPLRFDVLSCPDLLLFLLQLCGEVIIKGCQDYLCEVKAECVVIIVKVMEHIAQLYPAHFPMLLQPLLPTVLRNLIEEEVRREEERGRGRARGEERRKGEGRKREGRREKQREDERGLLLSW